ncbi:NAD(P)/FAD-dependent oxidoreductase [Massilia sp. H6]|uniref:NAD(P)/FAD-dependent oxidoreductase n=1 Tax=Massilia sp. H6 TaxID=2970464 RepID=UPI00216795DE|nr:NAD(P)/FAD-dependent oxidoreductase [Massilia sp. H6]UVW27328.1 NAD(P)/FAD-dependent oxidoreductase [Massilia sp. H6]
MDCDRTVFDTLIIGGGPAGLTAALYLRRFTRQVALVDKGNSRLSWIPVSHNYPGFPDGINGKVLLEKLRQQLGNYGGSVMPGEIISLRLEDGQFVAEYAPADGGGNCELRALTVLLASGVADAGMPVERWDEAVLSGAVRLCPVCDGWDVIDKRIGVVTSETNPVGHALFMRTFSADVLLFERCDESTLTTEEKQQLAAAGVRHVLSPLAGVTMSQDMTPILHTKDGEDYHCDVFYPMLGETARSDLASALGAETVECRKLLVDEHCRTSVPGLFAIGDVTRGLNQIAVATGQAALAATAIHNALPWALRCANS